MPMKSILSAAALLAVIVSPAMAQKAVPQTQTQPQVQTAEQIVPAVATPPTTQVEPMTETEGQSQASAKSGGCGAKHTVYLTN
jgi:hypothetical protein